MKTAGGGWEELRGKLQKLIFVENEETTDQIPNVLTSHIPKCSVVAYLEI